MADDKSAVTQETTPSMVSPYPIVALGYGQVEVCNGSIKGVPALIFGSNGCGEIGADVSGDRFMGDGETLCAVTFANRESFDVVMRQMQLIATMLAAAPAPTADTGEK